MQNLWDETIAANYSDELDLRVYTSRLLGNDKSLVLHGGGNTSVKIEQTNIIGESEEILYVKGSGWDLETIEAAGFAPVKMDHLLKLAKLEKLSDSQMVNELKTHLLDASAPAPSVETILHALLPFKYVDHTHADAIVSITNTEDGEQRIREIYGDSVVIIPYVMPGFDLSKLCAKLFPEQQNENTIGMVLMNHGIFSFGNSAKESYERMIQLVGQAEDYLKQQQAWEINFDEASDAPSANSIHIAEMRKNLSRIVSAPLLVKMVNNSAMLNFCGNERIAEMSQQGPATPDHVIRTKRLPLLTQTENSLPALDNYVKSYQDYFNVNSQNAAAELKILDCAPRAIIDPEKGFYSVGKSIKDANIIADIYQHTIEIIQRAEKLGGYQALPAKDIFDVEYWELEQAKLKKSGKAPLFSGEIALVTGAASGIGLACVESLFARGAVVVGLDIDANITQLFDRPDFLGICCDVTNEEQIKAAIAQTISAFGGLDMLILNAGIFPSGCKIADLAIEQWKQVMSVNLDANLSLLKLSHPYLKLAPNGGRVVIIGSKNVPAPGPGAAAYSASKAALNQLARVTALEWGSDNIRINSLHPNAVFDTGIWTDEVLQGRAQHYGLTVQEYKTNNLLKTEVTSHNVGELAAELCGPLFAKTTAAQIPVDGGNDRVV